MAVGRILRAARQWISAGFSVIPILADGSKAAALPWTEYIRRRPTCAELTRWFDTAQTHGLAVIGGAVSGNLCILDFDRSDMWQSFVIAASAYNADLTASIESMVLVETPSGCRHAYVRSTEPVGGNTKLARAAVPVPEGADGARLLNGRWVKVETLIETRGEGGYVVAPPSPAECHEEGRPWRFLRGRPESVPILDAAFLRDLLDVARMLDEMPETPEPATVVGMNAKRERSTADGNMPGDDYNRRGDVRSVLEGHGWNRVGGGVTEYWRRPGKLGRGWSATLREFDSVPIFTNFSANAYPFDVEDTPDKAAHKSYAPFAVFAILEHGGDYHLAARALYRAGYGDRVTANLHDGHARCPAAVSSALGRNTVTSMEVAACLR